MLLARSPRPAGPPPHRTPCLPSARAAPLTAGNFLANVEDGLYNGAKLSATYNSVLVGEPVSAVG